MVVEIKLINKMFFKELEIFYTCCLSRGNPMRAIGEYGIEDSNRINRKFKKLMGGRNLSADELEELESIVWMAWRQYVDLYSGWFERKVYLRFFRCAVYEVCREEEKNAIYLVTTPTRPKQKKVRYSLSAAITKKINSQELQEVVYL